jgi:hypothetical protein
MKDHRRLLTHGRSIDQCRNISKGLTLLRRVKVSREKGPKAGERSPDKYSNKIIFLFLQAVY